jgi:cholesterol transport system auxiliary component
MRNFSLIILLTLMLVGCSTTITPPIQEYTIYPSSDNSAVTDVHSPKTLRLSSTKAIPSLSSKNLYYLGSDGETGSYLFSRWSDNPSSLIDRSLSASLEEKGLFAALLSPASPAHADWILESNLDAFYHQFQQDEESFGVIDITYHLIDTKTKSHISSKHFRITAPAASEDARGGVGALIQATKELTKQSTQWLSSQIQEKK